MVTLDGILVVVMFFLLSLWMIHLILSIISLAREKKVIESMEMYQVFIDVHKYKYREGKRPKRIWRSGLRDVKFTKSALDEGVVDYQLDVKGIITEMEVNNE